MCYTCHCIWYGTVTGASGAGNASGNEQSVENPTLICMTYKDKPWCDKDIDQISFQRQRQIHQSSQCIVCEGVFQIQSAKPRSLRWKGENGTGWKQESYANVHQNCLSQCRGHKLTCISSCEKILPECHSSLRPMINNIKKRIPSHNFPGMDWWWERDRTLPRVGMYWVVPNTSWFVYYLLYHPLITFGTSLNHIQGYPLFNRVIQRSKVKGDVQCTITLYIKIFLGPRDYLLASPLGNCRGCTLYIVQLGSTSFFSPLYCLEMIELGPTHPDGTCGPNASKPRTNTRCGKYSSACCTALRERCTDALIVGMMIMIMMMTTMMTMMMMITCPMGRPKAYRPSLAVTLPSRSRR